MGRNDNNNYSNATPNKNNSLRNVPEDNDVIDNEDDDNNNNAGQSSSSSFHRHHQFHSDGISQMTASVASDSKRSTVSYESFRRILSDASQILVGRLPENNYNDDNDGERPSVVQVQQRGMKGGRSAEGGGGAGGGDSSEFYDATEHAVASSQAMRINFLQDDPREMTLARRIALSLANKPWYNPSLALTASHGGEENEGQLTTSHNGHVQPQQRQQNNTNNNNDPTTADETEGGISTVTSQAAAMKGRAQDAYPFSVSKREKPSLAKAWACTLCQRLCFLFLLLSLDLIYSPALSLFCGL